MPATMMHLYAARVFREDGSDAYFLGSILPDCVDAYREWKDRLHFRNIPKEERLPALVAFGESLDLSRDFDLGALFHFFLDYLWDFGPQKDHREMHGEENWFPDYRKELSRAGSSVAQRFSWSRPLWEKLRDAKKEDWENTLGLPEEEILPFLAKNFYFHTEEKLPKGEFFTDDLVDDFTHRAAEEFRLFLEKHFQA